MSAPSYYGLERRGLVRRGQTGAIHVATPHRDSSRWFALCGRYLGSIPTTLCDRADAPEYAEQHAELLCPDCRSEAERIGRVL